jgi:hypothetical protein
MMPRRPAKASNGCRDWREPLRVTLKIASPRGFLRFAQIAIIGSMPPVAR